MFFSTFLKDKNNDNIIGDYDNYPTTFKYVQNKDKTLYVNSIDITIYHSSKNKPENYGNIRNADINIISKYNSGNNIYELIKEDSTIKRNIDWFFYGDVKIIQLDNKEVMKIKIDLKDNPIELHTNNFIYFKFKGDFTSLFDQKILISGLYK